MFSQRNNPYCELLSDLLFKDTIIQIYRKLIKVSFLDLFFFNFIFVKKLKNEKSTGIRLGDYLYWLGISK
jgi:hypothetical protein